MARPLRVHLPLKLYHVRSRGNDRRPLFQDDYDHLKYLELVAAAVDRLRVRCLAYCLMTNHVHLLLQPTGQSVSRFMQQVGSSFASWSNRRHGRTGHLLDGRFRASLVENSVYFLRVLRYIVRNPVVANMIKEPEEWPWSSYRATAGLTVVPPFLAAEPIWRSLDRRSRRRAQEQFRVFVASDADDDDDFARLLVGSPTFIQSLEPDIAPHRTNPDLTCAERFSTRPAIETLFTGVLPGPPLRAAVRTAFLVHAYTLREIGAHLQARPSTVWTWVQRAGHEGFEKIEI